MLRPLSPDIMSPRGTLNWFSTSIDETCELRVRGVKPAFLAPCLRRSIPTKAYIRHFKPSCCYRRPRLDDVVNKDEMSDLRVGGLAVPRHRWRRDLKQRGVHRSVEYIVEGLSLDGEGVSCLSEAPLSRRGDVLATVRPACRLIPRLEREWPVTVTVDEAKLWSYKQDVAVCAAVCLIFAFSVIGFAFGVGEFCGIYGIASESMVPTLKKGDGLLVEKISIRAAPPRRGEVVLVRPPREVELAVRQSGRSLKFRDLLVKRVAAIGGDRLEVDGDGVRVNGVVVGGRVSQLMRSEIRTGTSRIKDGYVYVLGDNGDASVDSRFWGALPEKDVVGRPVARIFPLERFRVWGFEDSR